MLNSSQRKALEYVRNTRGGATIEHFVDDFDPIGQRIWDELQVGGYVTTNPAGRIVLTLAGTQALLNK